VPSAPKPAASSEPPPPLLLSLPPLLPRCRCCSLETFPRRRRPALSVEWAGLVYRSDFRINSRPALETGARLARVLMEASPERRALLTTTRFRANEPGVCRQSVLASVEAADCSSAPIRSMQLVVLSLDLATARCARGRRLVKPSEAERTGARRMTTRARGGRRRREPDYKCIQFYIFQWHAWRQGWSRRGLWRRPRFRSRLDLNKNDVDDNSAPLDESSSFEDCSPPTASERTLVVAGQAS
jgi:hypothetical protein